MPASIERKSAPCLGLMALTFPLSTRLRTEKRAEPFSSITRARSAWISKTRRRPVWKVRKGPDVGRGRAARLVTPRPYPRSRLEVSATATQVCGSCRLSVVMAERQIALKRRSGDRGAAMAAELSSHR